MKAGGGQRGRLAGPVANSYCWESHVRCPSTPPLTFTHLFCRVKAKGDECKRYVDHVAKLEEQYKWVVSERDSFGQGDFDFSKRDPKKVNQEYETAEKRLEELKGKVNHQVGGARRGGARPSRAK